MDKIWLANYPAGVPAEVDVDAFRSIDGLFARAVEQFAASAAFVNMGAAITFAELDRLSARFRRLSAIRPQIAARRARRADDAEYPAISHRVVRRAARWLHGGELQSALYRARTRAPARRFRRARPSSSSRTSRTCSKSACRRPAIEHIVITRSATCSARPRDRWSISRSNS